MVAESGTFIRKKIIRFCFGDLNLRPHVFRKVRTLPLCSQPFKLLGLRKEGNYHNVSLIVLFVGYQRLSSLRI